MGKHGEKAMWMVAQAGAAQARVRPRSSVDTLFLSASDPPTRAAPILSSCVAALLRPGPGAPGTLGVVAVVPSRAGPLRLASRICAPRRIGDGVVASPSPARPLPSADDTWGVWG